jgi:predicted membrane channel-forming protein YqfA (hemolysin III family)
MGPRAKQCTGGPYYTNNCMNKQTNLMIKLNIYLLYWYFQQNQCLNIKTHVIHNIHRLSWGPRATAPLAHALRRHWNYMLYFLMAYSLSRLTLCCYHIQFHFVTVNNWPRTGILSKLQYLRISLLNIPTLLL